MRIFAAACGLLMALLVSAPAFAREEKLDPSCTEVNDAYAATRSVKTYSVKFYDALPDGAHAPKRIADERYDEFQRSYRKVDGPKWEQSDRAVWMPSDEAGPKFRFCVLTDQKKDRGRTIRHFTALWHDGRESADADIWISAEQGLVTQMQRQSTQPRHFKFGTISGTVLEIFDYPFWQKAVPRKAPVYAYPPMPDDTSCIAVNYAYGVTRSTPVYSETFYDVLQDGSVTPIGDMEFDQGNARYRGTNSSKWEDVDLAEWSVFNRAHPSFQFCELVGVTEEMGRTLQHFTATSYQPSGAAPAEIWISAVDRRFERLQRRFAKPSDFKFGTTSGTVLETFDYAGGPDIMIYTLDP